MRVGFFILGLLIGINLGWGRLPDTSFYHYPYIHSLVNVHYRFFQNHPSEYEIGIEGKIPYQKIEGRTSPLSGVAPHPTLNGYTLMTRLGYTYISRGIDRHRYFMGQSWYGNFLQVTAGYGFTHRVNPLAAYSHELPLSLGGLVGNWELTVFGNLNWKPTPFLPLLGGNIAYLFYTHPPSLHRFSSRNVSPSFIIPHRIDVAVFQTSKVSFGMRHTYQFNLREANDHSPHLRLLLSWEIFPLKVGMAFDFAWGDWVQATSYTLYHPQWGFDHSVEVGVMNYYHQFYRNPETDNSENE